MVWAFHSESQELLVGACVNACGGKISWADARALGIPLWLNSIESLVRIWFILRPRLKRCKFFVESSDGGHCEERIHGWREPGSCSVLLVLLRFGET